MHPSIFDAKWSKANRRPMKLTMLNVIPNVDITIPPIKGIVIPKEPPQHQRYIFIPIESVEPIDPVPIPAIPDFIILR